MISAITGPEGAAPWQPEVVAVTGRFVAASNATLLGETADGTRVIYKPVAGEQPLWDFPEGTLALREVMTYSVSVAMGLDIVPETVMGTGVYGKGAVQRFVDAEPGFDPLPAVRRGDPDLWPVAVLDVVVNNADRKLGHILRSGAPSGTVAPSGIVAIDHGLTFHVEDKLRTVLWAFAGREVPAHLAVSVAALVAALDAELGARIADELGVAEAGAVRERAERLLAAPRHPEPPDDRPALPWPPY